MFVVGYPNPYSKQRYCKNGSRKCKRKKPTPNSRCSKGAKFYVVQTPTNALFLKLGKVLKFTLKIDINIAPTRFDPRPSSESMYCTCLRYIYVKSHCNINNNNNINNRVHRSF